MSEVLKPDICVIGAGSAGLSVAAAAASFGVPVVLVEKGKMGGDCLNYGCVPSKALIAAAKHAEAIRAAPEFGVHPGSPTKVSFPEVNKHVHQVISAIAPNDSVERFTAMGVKVIKANARFKDPKTLLAGDVEVQARRFVVATGSSPMVPPIPGLNKVAYFTNENLFENKRKPAKLLIIGGGPIGMEMAQAHARLGSSVTVIEGMKVFGKDDPETSAIVVDQLKREGVAIVENAMVSSVEPHGKSGVRVHFSNGATRDSIDGTHLLVATGRAPNVHGLDLEKAGVKFGRNGIEVRRDLRTSNRKIYAIGDVTGGLQFTHVAGYHAGLVIRGLLFRKRAVPDERIIPWVTYTDPELAQVGLTEEQARKQHSSIRVLRWPFHENDRAQAERRTRGLIKIVTDKKGRILGVSIAGMNAGEIINTWALALSSGLKLSDFAGYISPYPTLTEVGKRAAITFYAPLARKPLIRSIIGFLQKFG